MCQKKHDGKLGGGVVIRSCNQLDIIADGTADDDELQHEPQDIQPPKPVDPVNIPVTDDHIKYLRQIPTFFDDVNKELQVSVAVSATASVCTITPTEHSSHDWPTTAVDMVQSLLSQKIATLNVVVPPEAAKEVYPFIMSYCTQNRLLFDASTGGGKVTVTGDSSMVSNLQLQVKAISGRIIQAKETVRLTPEQYMFLKGCMLPVIQQQYSQVKMHCHDKDNTLSLDGSMSDVDDLKGRLQQYLVFKKFPVELHGLIVKYLQGPGGKKVLQNMLVGTGIVPYMGPSSTGLVLLCTPSAEEKVGAVVSSIKQQVKLQQEKLPQSCSPQLVESSKFMALHQSLLQQYNFSLSVSTENGQLVVASDHTHAQAVSQELLQFIIEECSVTKDVSIKRGVWRLLHTTAMERKWSALIDRLKKENVAIVQPSSTNDEKPFIQIKGEHHFLQGAIEQIKNLEGSVVEKRMEVGRPGICQYFMSDTKGKMMLSGVERAAGVCIEMSTMDDEQTSSSSGQSIQFQRICCATINQTTVNVYIGDITQFNKAEVIVNAANEDLKHVGGVASAIATKGGPIIQSDSDIYVKRKGKVVTGEAVIFHRVGNLPPPYRAIVHAVGPRWARGSSNTREIAYLKKVVFSSLVAAQNYSSIAIPAISGGIYGFPADVCADAVVQGVVRFSNTSSNCTLSDINFVVTADLSDSFMKACKGHLNFIQSEPDPSSSLKPGASPVVSTAPLQSRRRRGGTQNTSSTSTAPVKVLPTPTPVPVPTLTAAPVVLPTGLQKMIKLSRESILEFQVN